MTEEKIWFEMDDRQNPVLVKASGERITSHERSDRFGQTVQSQQGWQRSRLYMQAHDFRDATSFGALMSTTLSYGPDENGISYTFTSCEEADRRTYRHLTDAQVAACRRNVDDFYADPEMQRHWQQVILHPVCLLLKEDGSLEPKALAGLDPTILTRFQRMPIRIGDQ